MTALIFVALTAAIVGAALIGDRVRELRACVDLLLIDEDAADNRAQYAAMTEDERRRLHEDEAMALANDEPIYAATWAYLFSHQLEDPAAVDRFLRGGAA